MRIGENIKRIRKHKKIKRSELANKLKFMYGDRAVDYRTIERIENGYIEKGRMSTLCQIADGLDVDLKELLADTSLDNKSKQEESSNNIYITRLKERGGIFRYNDLASLELISPKESPFMSSILRIEPSGKTKVEQDPEGTIKFILVLDGEVFVSVGNVERVLSKGDSIYFKSSAPHYFENKGRKPLKAVLYQNPKAF